MILQLLIVASLLSAIARILNDFAIIFLLGARSGDILNYPMRPPAKLIFSYALPKRPHRGNRFGRG